MNKVREFLEYYAAAAKGVPAGAKAEAALAELDGLERAAEARGFERARERAAKIATRQAEVCEDWGESGQARSASCVADAIRAMKDETP